MKRAIAFALLLGLMFPIASNAVVLADGWDQVSLDELLPAHQKLTAQIEKLLIDHNRQFETITLQGDDKETFKNVVIPQAPARVTFVVHRGSAKATFTGLNYTKTIEAGSDAPSVHVLVQSGTFDVEIAHGFGHKVEWEFTIEPLKNVGFVKHQRSGPYVTDIFTLPKDASARYIATAYVIEGHRKGTSLYLYYWDEAIDNWNHILVSDGLLYGSSASSSSRYEDTVKMDELSEGTKCFWLIQTSDEVDWGVFPLK